MRILRRLAVGAGLVVATLASLVYWASRPAVDSTRLPREGITHFAEITATASPAQAMHIITYNIGYAYGDKNNTGLSLTERQVRQHLDDMIASLSDRRPDILGLQEVDFAARRTHRIDQLAYLAQGLRLPFAAYVITWNRRYVAWPYWPPARHFGQVVSGQAVLSRYPIVTHTTHTFAKPTSNPFWYNLFYLDRVAQRVTIDIGHKQVVVWHAHLEAFDTAARGDQLKQLATLIAQERDHMRIALGDFNSELDTEQLLTFRRTTGLESAEPPGTTNTFPSWAPEEKIDHIFYHPDYTSLVAGTIPSLLASDHLPVWAELAPSYD